MVDVKPFVPDVEIPEVEVKAKPIKSGKTPKAASASKKKAAGTSAGLEDPGFTFSGDNLSFADVENSEPEAKDDTDSNLKQDGNNPGVVI